MQITPYLSFRGDCEEAFTFYARCLGGHVGSLFRYAGSPMADRAPAGWQDKVMHGGRVVLPLEKTFWAARFGMLVDRFGVPWQVNCGETESKK